MRWLRRRPTPDLREWAVGFTVEFTDGGTPLSCVLGFGSREQCEGATSRLPARMPYTGPRTVLGGTFFACPAESLDARA